MALGATDKAIAVKKMEAEESAEWHAGGEEQRRATPRLPVDGPASLLVVKHETSVPCRVTDLSKGGCRIQTAHKFLAGLQVRVEVSFTVNGLLFRLCGTTQWTDGAHLVGIRFVDVTSRRMDELVELLTEVEQDNAAKAAKLAAEAAAAAEAELAALLAAEKEPELEAVPLACAGTEPGKWGFAEPEATGEASAEAEAGAKCEPAVSAAEPPRMPGQPAAGKPPNRERRTQSRHEVDTSAWIHLINVGSRLGGRIVDLSLGGCRIRTMDHFPVGIYTRVETEFRVAGISFRLGGVIQAVHDRDRFNVGIRFLEMSERKREQLAQLIEEIEKMYDEEDRGVAAGDAGTA